MKDLHQKQLKKPHHRKIQQPSIYGLHPVLSPVFLEGEQTSTRRCSHCEPHTKTGVSLSRREPARLHIPPCSSAVLTHWLTQLPIAMYCLFTTSCAHI